MRKKNCRVENLSIPILTGSFYDLQQFDFSFRDISIVDIKSKKFKTYIKKHQPFVEDDHPFSFIKYLEKNIRSSYDKFYAIIKNNPCEGYNYDDFYTVFKILLIIYPSDLQIEHRIDYHGTGSGATISSWNKRITGNYPGKPLFDKGEPKEVNEFLPLIFDRITKQSFISYIVENYITSFDASHGHYQFINLCICLEGVISGDIELNYRLRRSIAILCGENSLTSEIIFNNLKEIYTLRSLIVHGEKYDYQKIGDYFPFLTAIVSRTIIELFIHDIQTPKELDKIITRIGFGEREKISNNWKNYTLNLLAFSESNYANLSKALNNSILQPKKSAKNVLTNQKK